MLKAKYFNFIALINYRVKIEQYKDSHSLTSMSPGVDSMTSNNSTFRNYNTTLKRQNYFEIPRYDYIHETHITIADDARTRLGGVAQGLNTYLGGNASMYFGGAAGFNLDQSSNAPTYLTNDKMKTDFRTSVDRAPSILGDKPPDWLIPRPRVKHKEILRSAEHFSLVFNESLEQEA